MFGYEWRSFISDVLSVASRCTHRMNGWNSIPNRNCLLLMTNEIRTESLLTIWVNFMHKIQIKSENSAIGSREQHATFNFTLDAMLLFFHVFPQALCNAGSAFKHLIQSHSGSRSDCTEVLVGVLKLFQTSTSHIVLCMGRKRQWEWSGRGWKHSFILFSSLSVSEL